MKTEFARVVPKSPPGRRDRSRHGRACWIAPANRGIDLRGSTGESPLTDDRYSRFLFSGLDDLHCQRADSDACQPVDCSSLPSRSVRISGAAHLFVPDDHLHFCDVDHFLSKLKGAQPCLAVRAGGHLACRGEFSTRRNARIAPQARCLCSEPNKS